MRIRKRWIAVVVIVALIALFLPFVPDTTASGQFLGAHYQRNAMVSPTYYAFHCGSYIKPDVSIQLGSGYTGFYQLSRGYTFSCYYNSG